MRALLCWLLLPCPALAVPVSLPPGEDPAAWEAVLAHAGLDALEAEGAWIHVDAGDDGWWLQVRDVAGIEHRVPVAAPADDAAREDLVWLAASLLRPLRPPPESTAAVSPDSEPQPEMPPPPLQTATQAPLARPVQTEPNPTPETAEIAPEAPPPPPVAALPPEPAPTAEAAPPAPAEFAAAAPAPPAPPPASPLPPEPTPAAPSPAPPVPALTLALGAVTRRDSALGLDLGAAAGLRVGAWRPDIWLRLRPACAVSLGDTRVDVSSVDFGLGLGAPRLGPLGPHPGLALGLSRRSFSQDASRIATGWAPTLGLSLAQPLRLGPIWSLAPTLIGSRDLRRVSYRWPDGSTLDHPAWELSAALGLSWVPAE